MARAYILLHVSIAVSSIFAMAAATNLNSTKIAPAAVGNDRWECSGNLVLATPRDDPEVSFNHCTQPPGMNKTYVGRFDSSPHWCSIGYSSKTKSVPKICHKNCGCDTKEPEELCSLCCRSDAKTVAECDPHAVKLCPSNNDPDYCDSYYNRKRFEKLYVSSDPSQCVILQDEKPDSSSITAAHAVLGIGSCKSPKAVKFLAVGSKLEESYYLVVDDTASTFACFTAASSEKPNSTVKLLWGDVPNQVQLSIDEKTEKPKAIRLCLSRRDDCSCDIENPSCDAQWCLAAVSNKVKVMDCKTALKNGSLIAPKNKFHVSTYNGYGSDYCAVK